MTYSGVCKFWVETLSPKILLISRNIGLWIDATIHVHAGTLSQFWNELSPTPRINVRLWVCKTATSYLCHGLTTGARRFICSLLRRRVFRCGLVNHRWRNVCGLVRYAAVLFLFAIKIEDSFKVRGRAYNLRAPYKNMNLTYTCVISLWTMSLFNGSRGFPTSLFTLFDVCLWWSKRKNPPIRRISIIRAA